MVANNDINVSGMITALLHMAFTLVCCLGELFDNAIGAGAKNITLNLNTETNIVSMSDDGLGMDMNGLKRASRLYESSEASAAKQGCFGIGLKGACVVITNLEDQTHIISKTANTELVELKQDWKNIIANNEYSNQVRTGDDLSRNCEDVWLEHRVSEAQGTVINIKATKKNMEKLVEMTTSHEIDSLVYHLAWTYRKSIADGLKITLKIDGVVYKEVISVDPMEFDETVSENKQEIKLYVFVDADSQSTRLYFMNQMGQYGYVDSKKRGTKKFQVESPPPSFELKSSMIYRSAYNTDEQWNEKQDYVFDHVGFDRPKKNDEGKKDRKSQALYNCMGGRYFTRGNKTIHRFPIDKSKRAGDKDKYKFHDDSRHELLFTHEHDPNISLLINKSKLDEGAMDACVTDTLKYLDYEFEKKMGKLYEVEDEDEEEVVVHIQAPPAVQVQSPPVVHIQAPPVVHIQAPPVVHVQASPVVHIQAPPVVQVQASPVVHIQAPVESDSESASGSESDREVSPPAPIVTNVSASTQIRYLAGDSLRLLEQMKVSNRHLSEFETLLETVIRNYMSGTSDDESTVWLRFMTPDQKYNMTIELIGQKYSGMYMWYPMLCGSDVYNCYTQLFTNN